MKIFRMIVKIEIGTYLSDIGINEGKYKKKENVIND